MKVDVERLERSRAQLTVEVEEADVFKATEEASKRISEYVNIPGFRKGKVPRKILERRVGKEPILREAAEILVERAYPDAVVQAGVSPVSQPEISIEQIEEGKPFVFKATLDVMPEVQLGQYVGIEAEYEEHEVTDADVESTIEELRKRHAELVLTDRDTVQEGDTVVLDYEGFIDGTPFDGGTYEGYTLKIGSGHFIPGFEEQLVGVKLNETNEITVTFPEDYGAKDLAGKEAVFKVTVKEIKEEVLPELDDEFAKDVSNFETFAEFREDLENTLREQAKKQAKERFRDLVVEKVTENASIEFPDSLVSSEIDSMISELRQRLAMQGIALEQYLEITGQDETTLRQEMTETAKKRLKTSFVIEEIRDKENITVTDSDIEAYIEDRTKNFPEEQKGRIQEFYFQPEQRRSIERMLMIEKTVDFLEQHAIRHERSGDSNDVDTDGSGTDQ